MSPSDTAVPRDASASRALSDPCPCGTGKSYDACCGRYHRGESEASTACVLMRSRYSAYVMDEADYIYRTWHPATRPEETVMPVGLEWLDLDIEEVVNGNEHDDLGEVTYAATYRDESGREGCLREHSRFTRRGDRWLYLEGDIERPKKRKK